VNDAGLVVVLLILFTGDGMGGDAGKVAGPDREASRDSKVVYAFRKVNACPTTGKFTGPCAGYVVDHIIPLSSFGPDRPDNMQWQTVEAAKKKDQLEFEAYQARLKHEKAICPDISK